MEKKLGVRGRAMTGWKTIEGARYYFAQDGILQKSCWIDDHYVDADGKNAPFSTITPDGYIVNEAGERQKKATGWQTLQRENLLLHKRSKSNGCSNNRR